MYNKFLEKYLDNNPQKVLSIKGIKIRKVISPLLRFVVRFIAPNSKLKVLRRADIPKQPVVFAATHGFREDVEHTVVMVNRQAYVLNGSLQQVLRSIDGVTSWMAGMILVNRANKESRKASKAKITYALKSGASVIMYPEGTWNKSPNELVSGLFSGIYDVAKESGALVVPVATYRNGSKSYGIMGEAFNICDYDKTNGLIILRDKMATMQYEMMEEYGRCERKNLPYGSDADNYWDNYINDLMSEVKFYEYELEKNTKYREKTITPPNEAFAFMDKLIPGKENAFLFRNNLYIRRNEL